MNTVQWTTATPSPRQVWGVFIALVIAVVVIVVVFVYPGLPSAPCSANVWIPGATPLTTPGHWYCSVTVQPSSPFGHCEPGIGMVNGSAIVTNFEGYIFSVHLFTYCIEVANLGLNASATAPSGGIYNITVWGGSGLLEGEWHNWTSPQNDSGFQWQPPSVVENIGWQMLLLVAPHDAIAPSP